MIRDIFKKMTPVLRFIALESNTIWITEEQEKIVKEHIFLLEALVSASSLNQVLYTALLDKLRKNVSGHLYACLGHSLFDKIEIQSFALLKLDIYFSNKIFSSSSAQLRGLDGM